MVCTARSLMIAATLLAAGAADQAQQPEQLPPPLPAAPPPAVATPDLGPVPPYAIPTPEEALAPAVSPAGIFVDPPGQPRPGWFIGFEKAGVAAHFANQLTASVPVNGSRTDVLHVPSTSLGWGFSPGVVFGYRDPSYPAEYLFSYRYLAAQGTSDLAGSLGSTHIRSRLDQSIVDLDYAERKRLGDGLDLRCLVGVRTAFIYLDTQTNASATTADLLGVAAQQRASDFFVGAGPHAGLDLFKKLPLPGLALYARGDASGLWGSPHQTFTESFGPGMAANLGTSGASVDNQASQFVWTFGAQIGLSWAPSGWKGKQFYLGYQILEFWRVGMDSATGSSGDLTEQGVFLRGELSF